MIINPWIIVYRIIDGMIKKLNITESIYDIVTAYLNREHSPQSIADVYLAGYPDADSESTATTEPDCKIFYPWKDVLASMYMHPDKVRLAKSTCPICGKNLLRLHFSSPSCTWKAMRGRAGTMTICPSCPRQVDIYIERMK